HSYLVSIFFSLQRRASPTLTLASQAGPTFWIVVLQQVYFLPLISRGPHSSAWANPADVRTHEHTINRFLNELIEPPWNRSLRRKPILLSVSPASAVWRRELQRVVTPLPRANGRPRGGRWRAIAKSCRLAREMRVGGSSADGPASCGQEEA